MPPMPEKLFSGKARVISDILASDSGRIAGPPRPPLDTRPSTFISNSNVSWAMTARDGEGGGGFHRECARRGGELGPHRHAGDLLHHLGDEGAQLLVLADVRAHVLAVHGRAGI